MCQLVECGEGTVDLRFRGSDEALLTSSKVTEVIPIKYQELSMGILVKSGDKSMANF